MKILSLDARVAHRTEHVELRRLREAPLSAYVDLHSNPLVRRHMPLSSEAFDEDACQRWIEAKERMWSEHGYGPWSFFADGSFVGWGGLQPEGGDADLALVIHPDHWGLGLRLYREIVSRAFASLGLASITALLPSSRSRVGVMRRLGFEHEGTTTAGGHSFNRYRLRSPGNATRRRRPAS